MIVRSSLRPRPRSSDEYEESARPEPLLLARGSHGHADRPQRREKRSLLRPEAGPAEHAHELLQIHVQRSIVLCPGARTDSDVVRVRAQGRASAASVDDRDHDVLVEAHDEGVTGEGVGRRRVCARKRNRSRLDPMHGDALVVPRRDAAQSAEAEERVELRDESLGQGLVLHLEHDGKTGLPAHGHYESHLLTFFGDRATARRLAEESLRLSRNLEYPEGVVNACWMLGSLHELEGTARPYFQESLRVAREIDYTWGAMHCLTYYGR